MECYFFTRFSEKGTYQGNPVGKPRRGFTRGVPGEVPNLESGKRIIIPWYFAVFRRSEPEQSDLTEGSQPPGEAAKRSFQPGHSKQAGSHRSHAKGKAASRTQHEAPAGTTRGISTQARRAHGRRSSPACPQNWGCEELATSRAVRGGKFWGPCASECEQGNGGSQRFPPLHPLDSALSLSGCPQDASAAKLRVRVHPHSLAARQRRGRRGAVA